MLKNEYAKMGGNYRVVHHSELLLELLAQNKIKIQTSGGAKMTYHDPCYLGRYNHIYEQPRQLLNALNNRRPLEMAASKETSFCCGGGGGGMWKEEKTGERISHCRIAQAEKTGAETIVTACPFCSIMFHDAIVRNRPGKNENPRPGPGHRRKTHLNIRPPMLKKWQILGR